MDVALKNRVVLNQKLLYELVKQVLGNGFPQWCGWFMVRCNAVVVVEY